MQHLRPQLLTMASVKVQLLFPPAMVASSSFQRLWGICVQLSTGYYRVSKTQVILVFLYCCAIFSNEQTRKQPKSTEGSIWTTFFEDGSYHLCVCSQLCWGDNRARAFLIYTSECFYFPVFLKEKMVQSLFSNVESGGRERGRGEQFEQDFYLTRALCSFAALSALTKLTHLASDANHFGLYEIIWR